MIPIPGFLPELRVDDAAWAEGIVDLRGKLERLAQESRVTHAFLARVADDVLAAEAEESFERAAEIPLKQSTIERKKRLKSGGPGKRRGNRHTVSSLQPLDPLPGPMGLYAALTGRADANTPVGVREFAATSLLFGTKRWVGRYASAHYWGVPRHNIPARLDWLRTAESQAAAEERLKDVVADWQYGAMERAGFDHEEIAGFFDSDPDLRGRY